MKPSLAHLVAALLAAISPSVTRATLVESVPTEVSVSRAAAICRATVVGQESFVGTDGGIHTRTALRVDEVMKGRFPTVVAVVHAGGQVGTRRVTFSDNPNFQLGEERLLFLGRRADGILYAQGGGAGARRLERIRIGSRVGTSVQGSFLVSDEQFLNEVRTVAGGQAGEGEDLTAQAVPEPLIIPQAVQGLNTNNGGGFAARFLAQDRGEPIEYYVDTELLPNGITQPQALTAVSNAFQVWANVTSLKFKFAGLTNFGVPASSIDARDGRIRMQLHDKFNHISDPLVLGRGGNSVLVNSGFPSVGTGGRVGTNEFYEIADGSLILKHTQAKLTNAKDFEEVIAHEIGHILSLIHSSENANEPDPTLVDALMYFQIHGTNRGARLGSWDIPIIRQAYPPGNTPPFGFDRVMDIVTDIPSDVPNVAGINRIELRGYDSQTTNLTVLITNATAAGAGEFKLTNSTLYFNPADAFRGDRVDPANGETFYERVFYRISDGTNASPFYSARVISLQLQPTLVFDIVKDEYVVMPLLRPNAKGLPDEWLNQFFGITNLTVNANADADGDGISNIDEFRIGSNPTNAASGLRITSGTLTNLEWTARPYDLYEVRGTTDFVNWTRVGSPVVPTTTNGSVTLPTPTTTKMFLRVERVP